MSLVSSSLSYWIYIAVFGATTVACGVALLRAIHIEDRETRIGFVGLLVGSGGWAGLLTGFLLAPNTTLAYGLYLASLIVGLSTVGAWLYFCSAYTGRSFHTSPMYRRLAVGLYLGIVAIKLTNPIHGLYFTTEVTTLPFTHMTIHHRLVHWIITGVSYVFAGIGFFMIYELFLEADYDTRPLAVLVGVTALPVVFDIAGFASPLFIDINYEPIGVAIFAIGIVYAFSDRFFAAQLTKDIDEPVIYLNREGRIREYNDHADSLFPELRGSVNQPFADVLPVVENARQSDRSVFPLRVDGEDRYYLASDTGFSLGQSTIGQLVVLSDISESERYRRELERHNEQLEGFAGALRHELLNSLQVIEGWVSVAGNALNSGDVSQAQTALDTVSTAATRMEENVEDLATVARYGQSAESDAVVDLAEIARSTFETAPEEISVSIDGNATVPANAPRVEDLFEYTLEFAPHNNASSVHIEIDADEIVFTYDGDSIGENSSMSYFDYDAAVPNAKAGMILPNVRMLARTQGWATWIDTTYDDGLRVIVSLREESRSQPDSGSRPIRS